MNITALAEDKIRIDLNESDMSRFDITYSELDYSDVKTRRIIWTLLSEAESELGLYFDTKAKLLVEVCQKPSDGCAVFFTFLKNESASPDNLLKKQNEKLIFKAFDESSFTDALLLLKGKKLPNAKTTCLTHQNGFFAVVDTPAGYSDIILHILSEFGSAKSVADSEAFGLLEHGTVSCEFDL